MKFYSAEYQCLFQRLTQQTQTKSFFFFFCGGMGSRGQQIGVVISKRQHSNLAGFVTRISTYKAARMSFFKETVNNSDAWGQTIYLNYLLSTCLVSGKVSGTRLTGANMKLAFFGGKKDTKQINKTPAHISQATRAGRQSRVMEKTLGCGAPVHVAPGTLWEMLFPN